MVHSTLQGDHTDEKTLEGLEAAVVVMALVVLEEVVGVEVTELKEPLELLEFVELSKIFIKPK